MDDSALAAARILDGRHELTIRTLAHAPDSFSITYTVSPPLTDGTDAEGRVFLIMDAEDDLGNAYVDWGGAFGPAPDGSRTEGTITGQPAVPEQARALRVRITFLRGLAEYPYDLVLRLRTS
ncbi:hypothetical protein ACT1U9_32300 [Streptomyces sp. BR1]|uniref:hypothetical protein n=1 Tax=Streptomyces sp. BR1 TaxID=1592323 RepID=UPI00402BE412